MDEKSPAHVASIEVLKLDEVIVNIHKAQHYRAKYTESQECEDNVDLLVVNVVPVEKGIISWTLYVCISYENDTLNISLSCVDVLQKN